MKANHVKGAFGKRPLSLKYLIGKFVVPITHNNVVEANVLRIDAHLALITWILGIGIGRKVASKNVFIRKPATNWKGISHHRPLWDFAQQRIELTDIMHKPNQNKPVEGVYGHLMASADFIYTFAHGFSGLQKMNGIGQVKIGVTFVL